MQKPNWQEAFRSGPPITARPILVAHHLFQSMKDESTDQKDSALLSRLIRTTAEQMETKGTLGKESTRILNLWRELEKLGGELADITKAD